MMIIFHFIHSAKFDYILKRPEVSVLFQIIQTQPITAICQLAPSSRKNALFGFKPLGILVSVTATHKWISPANGSSHTGVKYSERPPSLNTSQEQTSVPFEVSTGKFPFSPLPSLCLSILTKVK